MNPVAPFPKGKYGCAGLPKRIVRAMHRDLRDLGTLAAVGRKWQRNSGTIADILRNHGLYTPDPVNSAKLAARPRVRGVFAAYRPATDAELDAMISGITRRVIVPPALKREWRHWPMAKRAAFVRRLHARVDALHPRHAPPAGPLPAGFEPFDYGTPAAWQIADAKNEGCDSQHKKVQIKIGSRGIIWRGDLWYWIYDTTAFWGAYYRGGHRGAGCALHQVVWIEQHGPIPPSHVLRNIDGNPNNLRASNYALATRDAVARENHSGHYARKGAAALNLLLKKHSQKERHGTRHEQPLGQLRQDARRRKAARLKELGRRQRARQAQSRPRRAQAAA